MLGSQKTNEPACLRGLVYLAQLPFAHWCVAGATGVGLPFLPGRSDRSVPGYMGNASRTGLLTLTGAGGVDRSRLGYIVHSLPGWADRSRPGYVVLHLLAAVGE